MGDLIESAGPPVNADIPQSPRCDVFFFSEKGKLHSILIYGSGGYRFAVKDLDAESKIFFSVLAVHYVFDLIYTIPSCLLQVLDTYLYFNGLIHEHRWTTSAISRLRRKQQPTVKRGRKQRLRLGDSLTSLTCI